MKTGPLRGFNAGNPKHLRKLDSVSGGAHHRPEIVDPDVVGPRKIELRLLRRDAERQILHHLAVCRPGDVLLVVIAHSAKIAGRAGRGEALGEFATAPLNPASA